jgi:glutathione synthase/RimK-type ligase-like ATP-grasp enzyme
MRTRALNESRLVEVEALLAAGADAVGLAFERAQLLDALGNTEDARRAYLDVLTNDSAHAGALNELGRLLDRTGFHTAARMVYRRVVDTHPDDPTGHGNLATSFLDGGETEAARRHYEIALRLDPDNVPAHQCLAILLLRLGDEEAAARHGRIGFCHGASAWPYRGTALPIPVLVVHSALGGNIPIDRFIDEHTFAKSTIVAEFYDPALPLPPHALVVNAIGDASRCRIALRAASTLFAGTTAPILNAPACVAATTRQANACTLAGLAGVVAPLTVALERSRLSGPTAVAALNEAGFDWPVIVRAPGFHTGQHCVLVERPEHLTRAVAELPGDELLVIQFVDVRGSDANVRKYRVMIVDGAVLPLHLAISRRWMVHYFSADMAERSDHQQEEAAFLDDMHTALGPDAVGVLRAIARRLGLDYGGIDFGIDKQRRVVVFEANATMIVPPSLAELLPHRRASIQRIEEAVRTMLLTKGRNTGTKRADIVVIERAESL